MTSSKIFGTRDRDEAHAFQAAVLQQAHGAHPRAEEHAGKYPKCECREDPNDKDEPYQVWTSPETREPAPAAHLVAPPDDAQLDALLDRLLARAKAREASGA